MLTTADWKILEEKYPVGQNQEPSQPFAIAQLANPGLSPPEIFITDVGSSITRITVQPTLHSPDTPFGCIGCGRYRGPARMLKNAPKLAGR